MKFIRRIIRNSLNGNRGKVFKNIYWATVGKISNIVSGLFVGILVARYLGPDNFGLMNYVIGYVTLFSILANFGLDNIEIRELSKSKLTVNAILGTSFCLRLFFSLLTILLILITLLIFESDRYTFVMIMVYSVSLILNSFIVIRNYFTSIILNEYIVKTEIARTLFGMFIKIFLLYFHFSLEWFIVASTFDFVLIASGYLYSYRVKVGDIREWRFNREIAKYLLEQSFPLLLSGTAIIIYQKIDQVMIKNMIDNAALGQFSVASKIIDLAIFIPAVIAQTLTPLLVKYKQENIEVYIRKRQDFMDIMVWSAFIIALFMCLFSSLIVNLLFGLEYADAIPVLMIMSWKTVFVALFAASGQLIIIDNLQKNAVLRNLLGCLSCVILNFILIPYLGIIGSALATVITMIFTGYFSHLLIPQYRFLFNIQNRSIISGVNRLILKIKHKND